jgi:hypothetical protein
VRAAVTRSFVAGALIAAVTAGVVVGGASPSLADGASTIEKARQAGENTDYTGQVTVKWDDQLGGVHTTTLHVEGGAGVVRVDGQAQTAATSSERWLFRDGGWDLMSPARLATVDVPAAAKYRFVQRPGVRVADRPTDLVVLWSNGRLAERFYQDAATGLVLRRDLFDAAGDIVRSVAFDTVDIGGGTLAPPTPAASVDMRPRPTKTAKAPYVAPPSLDGGYARVATLRQSDALQVVYSDGVHGLSMFEQAGPLDRSSIPAGGRLVPIGQSLGVTYAYAGGQVVVWQAGGSTFTVVGDGAPDDVVVAARSVPHTRSLSVLDRVRRACRDVLNVSA